MDRAAAIDVWLCDLTFPHYMDPLVELGERFNEAHPDHRVAIRGVNFRTLAAETQRAATAGRAPAVAEYYYSVTLPARDTVAQDGSPLFTSVEKAVGDRTEILGEPVVLHDAIRAARDYYTYHGDLTSMPFTVTSSLLYSNMTLLRAAGIARPPQTWEELETACEALAALPGGPGHRVTWANHGLLFQQAVAVQGGLLAEPDNGRSGRPVSVNLDSKEMLAWAGWWRRMHEKGHYLYTGRAADWYGTLAAFAAQEVAFRLSTSVDATLSVNAAHEAGFEIGVTRLPYSGQAAYGGNVIAGTSLWLADGLDERTRDGALAFMQFLNNARNAADWHKVNSFVPATDAAFSLLEAEGWFERNPHQRVASDQLVLSAGSPSALGALLGDFGGIHDIMTGAMEDVLVRGADVEARFTQGAAHARRLLDDYHAACRGPGPRGEHCFSTD
jgi:sn-glycerol 3-phosphate transport system substrate-binding protein